MDADALIDAETVLILVERPGEAQHLCGGLIGRLCRQGRPPFVVVLADGNTGGAAADRQMRRGLAQCGLDGGRLLMFGVAGELPAGGRVFEAAAAALCFVAWRHDCNVLCAAPAALAVARVAVAASGLGLVVAEEDGLRAIAAPRPSARDAAA